MKSVSIEDSQVALLEVMAQYQQLHPLGITPESYVKSKMSIESNMYFTISHMKLYLSQKGLTEEFQKFSDGILEMLKDAYQTKDSEIK